MKFRCFALGVLLLGGGPAVLAQDQVVISEIMYHPVEEGSFHQDGTPVVSLYEDIYEYLEIHNFGETPVDMSGWQLSGGIEFRFPEGTVAAAKDYLVIAKDPLRLSNVAEYALDARGVFGPYFGVLSNRADTIELTNGQGGIVDSVSYTDSSPWPITADALGVDDRWSGIDPMLYQYRGRSLERVSMTHRSQDPANWVASPLPGEPSPGRPNAINREYPLPIVIRHHVSQASDGNRFIRENQPALVECVFSSLDGLGDVMMEYFVDDINVTDEVIQRVRMVPFGNVGDGQFAAAVPGQPDRSVVRFRYLADRGMGIERISPRTDDPFEWHAYFVSPIRDSDFPEYDVFVSGESMSTLSRNISHSPRRVSTPNPPGQPRAEWNATEPGIFVHDGVVYDVHFRHHGSRYRRNVSRRSYKVLFPDYQLFNNHDSTFLTDKDQATSSGHLLFQELGFPTSVTRHINLYLNGGRRLRRLEQEEYNQCMLDRYYLELPVRSPERPVLDAGELYKCVGNLNGEPEGPYGIGNGTQLAPVTPRRESEPIYWTPMERYHWTFSLQNHSWRGHWYFKDMLDRLWVARETEDAATALRAYYEERWDIEDTLTYLAAINWSSPWDDTTHNHFLWQKRNGKWGMLPWDFDNLFTNTNGQILEARNFANTLGTFKDSFFQAFPDEFRERMFFLNNTFFHPENLAKLGVGALVKNYSLRRFDLVNRQCDLGEFERPLKPANQFPVGRQGIAAGSELQASDYLHSNTLASDHTSTTWRIRSANGDYEMPVLETTTKEYLTTLPLPIDILELGSAYYWRCVYTDANGHPSLISEETSFVYGPSSAQKSVLKMSDSTLWRYSDVGDDLGPGWRTMGFDDTAWQVGVGPFSTAGSEGAVPLQDGARTYYFRSEFEIDEAPESAVLLLRMVADDGAAVYLNGVEILRIRINSRSRSVRARDFASREIENPQIETFEVVSDRLVPGRNVLAVEIHRASSETSAITFDLGMEMVSGDVDLDLMINEIMADNETAVANGAEFSDWIELRNGSSREIDLGGMSLTDDLSEPDKFVFPSGTILPPRDFLVVWCDDDLGAPGLHTEFRLNAQGETVGLFRHTSHGPELIDYIEFGVQLADYSVGRIPVVANEWTLNLPSPNANNLPVPLGDVAQVRINEWVVEPAAGGDWFELYNCSMMPVDLGGLYLTDELGSPLNHQIVALSFVGGRGFLRLFADFEVEKGAHHVSFRLDDRGEAIGLFQSNGNALDTVLFASKQVGVGQGRVPNGSDRIVVLTGTPSPGAGNFTSDDRDGDGLADAFELANGLDPTVPEDAFSDIDGDGMTLIQELQSGTRPNDPESRLVVESFEMNPNGEPGASIVFQAVAGVSYSIQYAESLNPAGWTSFAHVESAEIDGPMMVLDPETRLEHQRYYRVVTPLMP